MAQSPNNTVPGSIPADPKHPQETSINPPEVQEEIKEHLQEQHEHLKEKREHQHEKEKLKEVEAKAEKEKAHLAKEAKHKKDEFVSSAKHKKDQVASKAKKEAGKLEDEVESFSKKFSNEASKKYHQSESIFKQYLQQSVQLVRNLPAYLYEGGQKTSNAMVVYTKSFVQELKNPVFATHFVGGVYLVSKLLNGYAHHARYLKGKSDKDILMIAGGVGVLGIADVWVSKKLYKKFE
ncbi:hypothetical protein ACO0RG_003115 [Hanseniaspora osmophila]|uniref:Mitochondrial outer membrane protein OM14 C-terminal domain-containing protein n=1 Tax=Hanseniaspora osmophila TaxID=56408 RepID=A0A1E5RFS6_9ASCO|nr:hypothetical protein AWRI3579_g1762 [Hanseniaspora osmophila]